MEGQHAFRLDFFQDSLLVRAAVTNEVALLFEINTRQPIDQRTESVVRFLAV